MDINIHKEGNFAFSGINIEYVKKGYFEGYNQFKALELIGAGWADNVVVEEDQEETDTNNNEEDSVKESDSSNNEEDSENEQESTEDDQGQSITDDNEEYSDHIVEEIKESGAGWMSVKLKGHDVVKVRTNDKAEALKLAIEKIKE